MKNNIPRHQTKQGFDHHGQTLARNAAYYYSTAGRLRATAFLALSTSSLPRADTS
jgi:hypothetical protein